ncbi:hypothetical protein [Methanobacterium sp.]|nr:hypothetical protein [Methanobacterium sp.]
MNPATLGGSPVCGGCLACIGCATTPLLAFIGALSALAKSQYY